MAEAQHLTMCTAGGQQGRPLLQALGPALQQQVGAATVPVRLARGRAWEEGVTGRLVQGSTLPLGSRELMRPCMVHMPQCMGPTCMGVRATQSRAVEGRRMEGRHMQANMEGRGKQARHTATVRCMACRLK